MGPIARRVVVAAAGAALAVVTSALPAAAQPGPPSPPPQPVPGPAVEPAPVPAAIPHLASPDNLPPGTSDTPVGPPSGRGLSYLRDLWQAMQTQEVSGGDALLLLTQRPLDPDATPPAHLAPGPQPPLPPPAPPSPPLP